jgi:hypothetical protein
MAERDLPSVSPRASSLSIVYLHLPAVERLPVYTHAAAAVCPGGRLVVVGHDRLQALEGVPGPDPDRLFTAGEIAAELIAADPDLQLEREQVVRRASPPDRGPIDALLILRRRK